MAKCKCPNCGIEIEVSVSAVESSKATTARKKTEAQRIVEAYKVANREPHFTPPTVQEIKAYCIERKNSINPQDFHDHYETRGWIPKGYTKQMKSWQAAVRTWEKYDKKSKPTNDGFMKAEDYLILEGSNDPA